MEFGGPLYVATRYRAWTEQLDEVGIPMLRKAALVDQAYAEMLEAQRDYERVQAMWIADVHKDWPTVVIPTDLGGAPS